MVPFLILIKFQFTYLTLLPNTFTKTLQQMLLHPLSIQLGITSHGTVFDYESALFGYMVYEVFVLKLQIGFLTVIVTTEMKVFDEASFDVRDRVNIYIDWTKAAIWTVVVVLSFEANSMAII